jgi:hypothetical protein
MKEYEERGWGYESRMAASRWPGECGRAAEEVVSFSPSPQRCEPTPRYEVCDVFVELGIRQQA